MVKNTINSKKKKHIRNQPPVNLSPASLLEWLVTKCRTIEVWIWGITAPIHQRHDHLISRCESLSRDSLWASPSTHRFPFRHVTFQRFSSQPWATSRWTATFVSRREPDGWLEVTTSKHILPSRKRTYPTKREKEKSPTQKCLARGIGWFSGGYHLTPLHPCMIYVPTFIIKVNAPVGKYTSRMDGMRRYE